MQTLSKRCIFRLSGELRQLLLFLFDSPANFRQFAFCLGIVHCRCVRRARWLSGLVAVLVPVEKIVSGFSDCLDGFLVSRYRYRVRMSVLSDLRACPSRPTSPGTIRTRRRRRTRSWLREPSGQRRRAYPLSVRTFWISMFSTIRPRGLISSSSRPTLACGPRTSTAM